MMFSAVSYITSSTDDWYARTGEGPAGTGNPHGSGMSYCYGCKQKIQDFNSTVVLAKPPEFLNVPDDYRGNISQSSDKPDPGIITGKSRWAGLNINEFTLIKAGAEQYKPFEYWSGIDCSGLVQRSIMAGKVLGINGVSVNVLDLRDKDSDNNGVDDGAMQSWQFYDSTRAFLIPYPTSSEEQIKVVKKIHRGDLAVYSGHIAMVYCTPDDDPTGECAGLKQEQYKIIHAYGWNYYTPLDVNGDPLPRIFSRKVLVTGTNIGVMPIGFGRIILWK
jgi:hypothetical protein